MALDPLPFAAYHRAAHLGAGSFGSVVTVYNDDGEEYALKLFLDDDDDNEDDDTDALKPVSLGAMREISCLRLLRGQHDNIISLVDIQPEFSEEEGAGTSGCLGMALPLYRNGSLADAIERKTFQAYPKKVKAEIAHGILSAVAFLHDNGILHRDIKSDNIMLDRQNESWKPILIDFSLAKPVDYAMWCVNNDTSIVKGSKYDHESLEHTGEVGTVVYTAPEIINQEKYGKPSDIYSVGVVLLELLQNQTFSAFKHKEAVHQISSAIERLPIDAPFPNLVRSMLQRDPASRLTARQALEHPIFGKFGLHVPSPKIMNIASLLPYADNDSTENESPNVIARRKSGKSKLDPKLAKRINLIDKICSELNSVNPLTKAAALEYSQLMEELDEDLNNLDKSQTLLDCVVLAFRFFEFELLDLHDFDAENRGRFASWDLQTYADNEGTIFLMTDYCLYPRKLSLASVA